MAGLLAAAVPGACAPEADEPRDASPATAGVDAVEEGMTMEQVLDLWGTPNVRVRDEDGERWSYWFRDAGQRVVGKAYVWFDVRRRVYEVRRTPEERPRRETKPPPITVTLGPAPSRSPEAAT